MLERVPVTILTGFFGSGKTTLLNRLLMNPDLADTAVIINEFGEVGIDHLLVEQAFEDAVLLKNGCICCTIRGDIADTLDVLAERAGAGQIPDFGRIVIETTGLADPAPVAHTLAGYRGALMLRLDGIVTTVDALLAGQQFAAQPEMRQQAAFADRILLTKTDLASASQQECVERLIRTVNAAAPIRRIVAGDALATDVFDLGPGRGGDVARWFAADVHDTAQHEHGHPGEHAHQPAEFHHAAEIATTVIRHEAPIEIRALRFWLKSLLSIRGADVLRVKGIVHLVGQDRPLVLQAVQHVLHPLVPLPRGTTLGTQIVVIGRGLSSVGLHASFLAALGSSGNVPARPG